MKKIIVVSSSKNPVKMNAALKGFELMFPEEQFSVDIVPAPSGVSDQPMSDEETRRGAENRVETASKLMPEADYWVGLESGLEEKDHGMESFSWAVIKSKEGKTGKGKTGIFFLPNQVVELIRQGKDLGEADDIVFGRTNSKQQGGAVGLLTGDVVDRTEHLIRAVAFALIPFKNPTLY